MAKKEATLTHKVRNPQDLSSWLDIWTATVSANFDENNNARTNEKIVITPSNNWQITADKLGAIPVTQIADTNDKHNVTISRPIEPNVLTKTDENGNLVAGPTISTSDEDTTQFLNQKGVWADVNPPFTVDLEKITVNNQEEPTPNAEFKVGNKSVIVKPQGKLAFSTVVDNRTINLSLGSIGTEDIKENTIKLGNLDLEGLKDPNNPNLGIEFRLPLKNIEDLPENSAKVTGMVKYGNAKESPSVWLTTAAGQRLDENNQLMVDENNNPIYNYAPDWGKIQTDHIADSAVTEVKIADGSVTGDKLSDTAITDKFDTKLLGVSIQSNEPTKKETIVYPHYSFPEKISTYTIAVQKTGAVLDEDYYTVRISSEFTMVETNGQISVEMTTVSTWTVDINNQNYVVTRSNETNTLTTLEKTDTLPDLFVLADKWKTYFATRYNNVATDSPKRISSVNAYTNIKSQAIQDIKQNYLDVLETTLSSTTILSDYLENETVVTQGDYNNWDWEHLGIWVEI